MEKNTIKKILPKIYKKNPLKNLPQKPPKLDLKQWKRIQNNSKNHLPKSTKKSKKIHGAPRKTCLPWGPAGPPGTDGQKKLGKTIFYIHENRREEPKKNSENKET